MDNPKRLIVRSGGKNTINILKEGEFEWTKKNHHTSR